MVYNHRIQGQKSSSSRFLEPCMMRGTPVDLLFMQLKDLGFELIAEKNKIKIEGLSPFQYDTKNAIFDSQSTAVQAFEGLGKGLRDLKTVSVKIPLYPHEKALLKLAVKWENKPQEGRGKDIFYHPPRNVSIPTNLEYSCYNTKSDSDNVKSGYLYVTDKRVMIYTRNKEKLNIHTFQILTRLFYQDAVEIEYHSGERLYKLVLNVKQEDFPLVQSVLMSHG